MQNNLIKAAGIIGISSFIINGLYKHKKEHNLIKLMYDNDDIKCLYAYDYQPYIHDVNSNYSDKKLLCKCIEKYKDKWIE